MTRLQTLGIAAAVAIGLGYVASCGSSSSTSPPPAKSTGTEPATDTKTATSTATTTKLNFTTDVAPIITANCSDAGCHGKTGASGVSFQDNETAFKAESTLETRLNSDMPTGKVLAAADKAKLIAFFKQ
jgi:hypothetical protein